MKSHSKREIEVISFLELEGKRFFTRIDIRKFFKSRRSFAFAMHKLKSKKRVVKINKEKYYLIPIQAFRGKWSEHPFIIIDEIFSGKNYFIGGKAAAHYWGLIEQIPTEIDAYSTTRQGKKKFFDAVINFKRVRKLGKYVERKVKNHKFNIATKEMSRKWI